MKKLIIHADDFGLNRKVSEEIAWAIRQGAVTSASLMANFDTDYALELARKYSIDIGWHVNLTEGFPVLSSPEVSSLVRKNGSFYPLRSFIRRLFLGQMDIREIERELRAQWQKILGAGIPVSHLDGHHHVHVMPLVREVLRRIAVEYRIPYVRLPDERGGPATPRFFARLFLRLLKGSHRNFWEGCGIRSLPFYGLSLGNGGSLSAWRRLLTRISSEGAEVMVHPGEPLKLLTSPEWKSLLREMGFRLVGFQDLPVPPADR